MAISGELAISKPREVTDEEVAHYREEGWGLFRNLISPETAAALLAKAKEIMGESGQEYTPQPGKDIAHRSWYDYGKVSREGIHPFVDIGRSAEMGKAAQKLMCRDIPVRHFSDFIFVRPPARLTDRDEPTHPHQDAPSKGFDRVGQINFWIALDEVTPDMGALRFYRGSHKEGSLGWDGRNEALAYGSKAQPPDLLATYPWLPERCPLSEPLHLMPGDATCHHMYTVHCAPKNTSDRIRWSYLSAYFPADALYIGGPYGGSAHSRSLEIGKPFDTPDYPIVFG